MKSVHDAVDPPGDDEAPSAHLGQGDQDDVVADGHRRDDALRLAVLRQQHGARRERRPWRTGAHTPTADLDAAVVESVASRRSPAPSRIGPSRAGRPARAPRRRARSATRRGAGVRAASPTASSTTSSPTCWLRSKLVRPSARTSAISRPSIVAITSSLVVSLIIDVRARRPSRRIVIRSAIVNTSSSLWLTKSRATPGAAQPAHHLEHLGDLARLERRRRLVEDDDARVGGHGAHDGDHLLHARLRTSAPVAARRCRSRSGAAARRRCGSSR